MLTFGLGKLRAPVVAFLSWANTPQMVVANRKNPTVQRILKSLGVNILIIWIWSTLINFNTWWWCCSDTTKMMMSTNCYLRSPFSKPSATLSLICGYFSDWSDGHHSRTASSSDDDGIFPSGRPAWPSCHHMVGSWDDCIVYSVCCICIWCII